jgi:WD40 repeat protein
MKKNYIIALAVSICSLNYVQAQDTLWTRIAQPDSLQVNGVAFSAGGNHVLSGTNCHPAHLRLWDVPTGNLSWDYEVPSSLMCLMGVGMSANSNYIATVEEFGNVIIFDNTQASPDSINTITTGTTYAFSIAFSPNSSEIAIGGSSGKLNTYNVLTGLPDLNITAHTGYVYDVAYSPDNLKIATCAGDNKIKIWDTLGNLLHTFTNHTDDVLGVEFTPDNARLVSCSKDNTVKIFDALTYTLIQTINVSGADVNAIAVSPDGSYLITGSSDARVRLFNLTTYQLIQMLPYASGSVFSLSWSPLGDKVVSGTGSGKVVLYDVSLIAGIESTETSDAFSVWPNPFTNSFSISTGNYAVNQIIITDMQGRTISQTQTNFQANSTNQMSSGDLAPGMYLITLITDNGQQLVQRIIRN